MLDGSDSVVNADRGVALAAFPDPTASARTGVGGDARIGTRVVNNLEAVPGRGLGLGCHFGFPLGSVGGDGHHSGSATPTPRRPKPPHP